MKSKIVIFGFLFVLFYSVSFSQNNERPCSMLFASVTVSLNGEKPEDCFTIRTLTGDTLRFQNPFFENQYTVLDDTYQKSIRNKKEKFQFIITCNHVVKTDESYIIGADDCHVYKVSGKDTVTVTR